MTSDAGDLAEKLNEQRGQRGKFGNSSGIHRLVLRRYSHEEKPKCMFSSQKRDAVFQKKSPADSPETTSPTGKSFTDILDSIDKRLSSFDARLSLVEILHREFKSLRESLEFSQQQVETLAAENASLRDSVKSLTENVTHLSEENKKIKETVIDLQARSMRDNLVFSGIPESAEEDPEVRLKLYQDIPEASGRHRGKHMLRKSPSDGSEETWSPEAASYCGQIRILQAERAGEESRQGAERNRLRVNDQFPKEILERRKICSQSDAVSSKGLPSCHRSGPALRGRAALPQPQYHSVVILTPLQIRIRYIFFFFPLFPRLFFHLPLTIGVQRIIDDP